MHPHHYSKRLIVGAPSPLKPPPISALKKLLPINVMCWAMRAVYSLDVAFPPEYLTSDVGKYRLPFSSMLEPPLKVTELSVLLRSRKNSRPRSEPVGGASSCTSMLPLTLMPLKVPVK